MATHTKYSHLTDRELVQQALHEIGDDDAPLLIELVNRLEAISIPMPKPERRDIP